MYSDRPYVDSWFSRQDEHIIEVGQTQGVMEDRTMYANNLIVIS